MENFVGRSRNFLAVLLTQAVFPSQLGNVFFSGDVLSGSNEVERSLVRAVI